MRTIKDPDVRRAEILDAAQQLFVTKGYAKTTVIDILQAIGIAKGTFYYYFKSKEEVMDAVIERLVERDASRAGKIASDPDLPVLDKFYQILKQQQPESGDAKDRMLEQFHHPGNAEMHQRSLVLAIGRMAPILAEIAGDAMKQGIFTTPYPQETIELLLVSGQIMFDEGLFQWEADDYAKKVEAFVYNMELLLGAKHGTLAFMKEILIR